MRAARRAGTTLAITATFPKIAMIATSTEGSVALTLEQLAGQAAAQADGASSAEDKSRSDEEQALAKDEMDDRAGAASECDANAKGCRLATSPKISAFAAQSTT